MCPLYISGLIGPGDRKSVQPMAARLAPGEYDQLHHFIADGVWDAAPLEAELLVQADRLVGGKDAVLVIDDTAMPKKGDRSVGVAPQYASSLGKTANCQSEREEKLYFVRETKSTLDNEERRTKENQKIACGRKHFDTLGVDYDVVTSLAEVAF
jgi:SRSO17 transposase